jgi:F-type H+-transporting ATPase subunit b
MLEINSTIIIQIINFLVLLLVLNILLYRPIRGIISRRNNEMYSLQGVVDEFQKKIMQQEVEVEESAVLARKEGYQERERLKGQGLGEEKRILQEASSSAEEKVGQAKKEIDAKLAEVKKTLEEQVSLFSSELAEKILGRSVK